MQQQVGRRSSARSDERDAGCRSRQEGRRGGASNEERGAAVAQAATSGASSRRPPSGKSAAPYRLLLLFFLLRSCRDLMSLAGYAGLAGLAGKIREACFVFAACPLSRLAFLSGADEAGSRTSASAYILTWLPLVCWKMPQLISLVLR